MGSDCGLVLCGRSKNGRGCALFTNNWKVIVGSSLGGGRRLGGKQVSVGGWAVGGRAMGGRCVLFTDMKRWVDLRRRATRGREVCHGQEACPVYKQEVNVGWLLVGGRRMGGGCALFIQNRQGKVRLAERPEASTLGPREEARRKCRASSWSAGTGRWDERGGEAQNRASSWSAGAKGWDEMGGEARS